MNTNRQLPGLDLAVLETHLAAAAPGMVHGPLTGEVIAGGKSNLTYDITDGTTRWVLRRPPLGHVLATAHDMAREYRVISSLAPTSVPVPRAVLLCTDAAVLGAPFYLMDRVAGRAVRAPSELAGWQPVQVRALAFTLVDTLATLHAVDPAAVGLADFGRPQGFNERQLRRWRLQLDSSRSRDLPGLDELYDALTATVPVTSATAIVHGDYRLDNVLIDGDVPAPQITAVLDWEMSTLGDPLGDLALFLLYSGWSLPTGDVSVVTQDGPQSTMLDVRGFPGVAQLVDRYAARSGRDLTQLRWYRAFAAFKLAAIAEGVYYRYRAGHTVGEGFSGVGAVVLPLIRHGLEVLAENPARAGGSH